MSSIFRSLLVTAALVAPLGAMAQSENVFVRLYAERLNVAKAEVLRSEADAQFQTGRLDRARRLLSQNAISREEYEGIVAEAQKARADVIIANARVAEAEATLEVVKSMVASGEAVPLCR